MKDVNCPYCNSEQEIDHDGGVGYEEGVTHNQRCSDCGKTFAYTTSISFYYEPSKADCLNDGEHRYGITNTHPKCFSKMVCSDCGDERDLTDEERAMFNIGTSEEYLECLKTINP